MTKIKIVQIVIVILIASCNSTEKEKSNTNVDLSNSQKDSLTKMLQEASMNNNVIKIDDIYNTYVKPNCKDTNDVQFYLQRAHIKLLKSDFNGSLQDLNIAEKKSPKTAHVYFMKGLAVGMLNPYTIDSSLIYFDKAIALAPNDPQYLETRAETYNGFKNYPNAIEDINKAIKLNPNKLWFYNLRASYLYGNKDYEKALKDYSFCIEHKKMDGELFYFRGMCYYKSNEYELALKDFNSSIKLNPENGAYYTGIGAAKFKLKDRDGAFENFKKAMELGDEEGKKYYYQCLEWYEKHKKI